MVAAKVSKCASSASVCLRHAAHQLQGPAMGRVQPPRAGCHDLRNLQSDHAWPAVDLTAPREEGCRSRDLKQSISAIELAAQSYLLSALTKHDLRVSTLAGRSGLELLAPRTCLLCLVTLTGPAVVLEGALWNNSSTDSAHDFLAMRSAWRRWHMRPKRVLQTVLCTSCATTKWLPKTPRKDA